MDLEMKVELATEILNSLIGSESMIDASENNEYLTTLLFERAQVANLDEEVVDRVIKEYGPIVSTKGNK